MDTRDIAIRADESGKSAHKRLDGYNGQIRKLGEEVGGLRDDFNRALYGNGDGEDGLVYAVVDLKATVRGALKIAAVIASAAIVICTGLTVYAIEHAHLFASTPPQAIRGK